MVADFKNLYSNESGFSLRLVMSFSEPGSPTLVTCPAGARMGNRGTSSPRFIT